MRAVIFSEQGSIESLKIAEFPVPEPRYGEVRIKLTSAGLNRADTLFPEGRYFCKPSFSVSTSPHSFSWCRIGFEGAGIVDAIGEGAPFNLGDRVAIVPLALDVNQHGCLAEYGIYDSKFLILTPETIPDEIAGGIWMQYLTAWGGLVTDGQLKQGQTVVITAASSSVGIAAIQVANMLGAISIATTRSDDKVEQLKAHGAQFVINMKTDDYVARIKEITYGNGTDLVFDAVAGVEARNLVQGSAKGGKIIIQGMLDRHPMDIHAGVLMKRLLTLKGFTLDVILQDPTILTEAVKQITQGLNSKQLVPVIAETFALTEFHEAFTLLKSNKHVGKIVITF